MASGERYVFVTGGSRGIGRAIVEEFAAHGYRVAFTYHRCRGCAEEVLREVRRLGSDGFYLEMDAGSWDSVRAAAEELRERIPYLNVLVNNAGIISFNGIRELGIEEWRRVIEVDLTGVFMVTKALLPLLEKAPWASIVNIASIAGETGNVVASPAYCAAKAGVIGLTKRLAVELAPHIRVNAVAPSFVETDMVRSYIDTREKLEKVKKMHPLSDIARPRDVAKAVYFLADPEHSRFITGHVLRVNGGRYT